PTSAAHDIAANTLIVAGADEPCLRRPVPRQQRACSGVMDDSPIAGEETALGRRNDFSEGRDAVQQRHDVTAFARSGHSDSTAFDHSPLVAASAYALDPYLNIGLPTLYDEPKPLCRPSGRGKQLRTTIRGLQT